MTRVPRRAVRKGVPGGRKGTTQTDEGTPARGRGLWWGCGGGRVVQVGADWEPLVPSVVRVWVYPGGTGDPPEVFEKGCSRGVL